MSERCLWLFLRKAERLMDELTARIEALMRRLDATASDQTRGDLVLAERFRMELQLLVSEYGPAAVNAVLDALPDTRSPSDSLH
jgi:hypothetical protein